MTNRIAIWLALVIVLFFVADRLFFGGILPVFLGRGMLSLVEFIAFWR